MRGTALYSSSDCCCCNRFEYFTDYTKVYPTGCILLTVLYDELAQFKRRKLSPPRMPLALSTRTSHNMYYIDRHELLRWNRVTSPLFLFRTKEWRH